LSVDNASSLAAAAPVSCTSVYTGQAHSSSVYLGMHGYTQLTVTWSSSVGAIAAPHLYRSPPAGIGPVLPGYRPVLPAPAYGWPPYAIDAMPYVSDGLFRPAVNHYTDTAISNDMSRLTLDHYSAAAAVHPQPTGLAPSPGVVPTLLHQGQVMASTVGYNDPHHTNCCLPALVFTILVANTLIYYSGNDAVPYFYSLARDPAYNETQR